MKNRAKKIFYTMVTLVLILTVYLPVYVNTANTVNALPADSELILMLAFNDEILSLKDSQQYLQYKNNEYNVSIDFLKKYMNLDYIYDGVINVLVLYNRTFSASFDINEKTIIDQNGNSFNGEAYYDNGSFYVPAGYAAMMYRYNYSVIEDVVIVRISNTNTMTDDEMRLAYLEKNPVIQKKEFEVYYVFISPNIQALPEIFNFLQSKNTEAMFAMTKEDIIDNSDLIISIIASGQPLLLIPEFGNEEIASEKITNSLNEMNNLLYNLTKTTSFLYYVPYQLSDRITIEHRDAAAGNGYRCYNPSAAVNLNNTNTDINRQINVIIKSIEESPSNLLIEFSANDDDVQRTRTALNDLFDEIEKAASAVYVPTILNKYSKPVNRWFDIR